MTNKRKVSIPDNIIKQYPSISLSPSSSSSNTSNSIYNNTSVTMIDPFSGKGIPISIECNNYSPSKLPVYENNYILAILILVWYGSAIITITSTKEIMNRIQFPFMLCTTQFLCASILSGLYTWLTKTYKPCSSTFSNTVNTISLAYTLGFILTNFAFSKG